MTPLRRKKPRAQRRRPRSPKEHGQRLSADLRTVKVLALRIKGLSLRAVAAELHTRFHIDVSHEQVRLDEQVALTELADQEKGLAAQRRLVEGQRLDVAQAAIWPKVQRGDVVAVGTFIRLSERRSALYGLNMPTRVTVTPETRPFQELGEAELAEELRASVAQLEAQGLLTTGVVH